MPVYLDPLMYCVPNRNWKWGTVSHLIADSLSELHELARNIGLRKSWFQGKGSTPHYDLTPGKRPKAIRAGAVPLDRPDFVRKVQELRELRNNPSKGKVVARRDHIVHKLPAWTSTVTVCGLYIDAPIRQGRTKFHTDWERVTCRSCLEGPKVRNDGA